MRDSEYLFACFGEIKNNCKQHIDDFYLNGDDDDDNNIEYNCDHGSAYCRYGGYIDFMCVCQIKNLKLLKKNCENYIDDDKEHNSDDSDYSDDSDDSDDE